MTRKTENEQILPENRLKETLRMNGLDYKLIERNDRAAIYETYINGRLCGFEVIRIQIKHNPLREALPSNDDFGLEGSRCYFAGEPLRARRYFKFLTKKLTSIEQSDKSKH